MKPTAGAALAALLVATGGVAAQDVDDADASVQVVEEIIVTAFKRA